MADRVHVIIRGGVQGVGFRFATYREATRLGLNGFVRNHADGTVEAEFEGEAATLEIMLEWCAVGSSFARVESVSANRFSGDAKYTRFEIR